MSAGRTAAARRLAMLTPVLLVIGLFAMGLTMAAAQSLGWLGLDARGGTDVRLLSRAPARR